MRSRTLVSITALLLAFSACSSRTSPTTTESTIEPAQPIEYTYKVVASYPHDPAAFTQGLVYKGNDLYESTGLVGQSSLRKVDLETGEVQKIRSLPAPFFGEGIAVIGDSIFQLTWQSHVGFVYNKDTFEEIRQFLYSTEGWGITDDGKRLIMSDGTAKLRYLDPQTLEVTGYIDVYGAPASIGNLRLNELEYVQGEIFANVWPTDYILIIDPATGRVKGWTSLAGILDTRSPGLKVDVLNGIAYDARNDRLFVTGKLWPWLFEIKLVRQR